MLNSLTRLKKFCKANISPAFTAALDIISSNWVALAILLSSYF